MKISDGVTDLIREDLIIPELSSKAKKDVLAELAGFLAAREGLDRGDIERVLAERERQGSTAVGEGIAIPHGKLNAAGKLIACLGRSRRGIDFGSADGSPTYFFVALVVPERSAGAHLKALARISRLFMDKAFRARLLAAETAGEMREVLAKAESVK